MATSLYQWGDRPREGPKTQPGRVDLLCSSPPPASSPHPRVLTVLPSCNQEKERSWHQQELDKALESLKREKTELEMKLQEQQADMETIRRQREKERAEAESALCQVGSWEDPSCDSPYL